MKPELKPAPSRRAQRGVAAVEVAFISILLFTLLLGAFVLGRLVWQYNVIAAATNAGARYLSAGPWSTQRLNDAEQIIVDMGADAGLTGITFNYQCQPPGYPCDDPRSDTTELNAQAPFSDPSHSIVGDGMSVMATVTVRNSH